MKKNIIEETIANIVSQSKVLKSFCNNPKPWNLYAAKLKERVSSGNIDDLTPYHNDTTFDKECPWIQDRGCHDDRHGEGITMIGSSEEKDCCCSGCMDCLGLSWRDFI